MILRYDINTGWQDTEEEDPENFYEYLIHNGFFKDSPVLYCSDDENSVIVFQKKKEFIIEFVFEDLTQYVICVGFPSAFKCYKDFQEVIYTFRAMEQIC